uniref:Uncharacterized protein n=1 Tax=Romanomermis culicivorax TaxID=13658 RepID=A0A915K4U7_ROMCU
MAVDNWSLLHGSVVVMAGYRLRGTGVNADGQFLVNVGASSCAVATAEIVRASAVEKRRICWGVALYSEGGDQLKVCRGNSGPVNGPCYGGGGNSG